MANRGHHRPRDITLEELTALPTVEAAADLVSRVYDFARHPFFAWMRAPTTTLEDFRESQLPYRYMVEHFSRSLAAVLARIGDMTTRVATVLENVVEEHGGGKTGVNHRDTIVGYLRAIGVRPEALGAPCPIRICAAYEALLGYCLTNPPEGGAGALGIVEYTHIQISDMLARNMHERFWGDVRAQYHYRIHSEIDVDHARDLFAVCGQAWGEPSRRRTAAYGMLLGAHYWWSVFEVMLPTQTLPELPDSSIAERLRDDSHAVEVTRVECDLPADLRLPDGAIQAVRVVSLGRRGALVQAARGVERDAPVELALAGGRALATRARFVTADGALGLEFARGLAPEELARALAGGGAGPAAAGPAVRVTGYDHVGVRVSDKARAIDFYGRLGFRVLADEELEEHRAVELATPSGVRLNLIYNGAAREGGSNVLMDLPDKWPGITHVAFVVPSLAELMRACEAEGIALTEGPLDIGGRRRICFVRDPDGNVLEFDELFEAPALSLQRRERS